MARKTAVRTIEPRTSRRKPANPSGPDCENTTRAEAQGLGGSQRLEEAEELAQEDRPPGEAQVFPRSRRPSPPESRPRGLSCVAYKGPLVAIGSVGSIALRAGPDVVQGDDLDARVQEEARAGVPALRTFLDAVARAAGL